MSEQAAMPWSRTDIPEFPEAPRELDLDILIKRREALLAPGERYNLVWREPVGTPPQHTHALMREVHTSPSQAPETDTNRVAPLRTVIAPERIADEEDESVARRPSPVEAKKQKTTRTKTNWKTMDFQDTDSEQ